MRTNTFLQRQIDLLVESFGEETILRALRRSGVVDQRDGRLRQPSAVRTKKKKASDDEIISKIAALNPFRSSEIEKLGQLFRQKQFLSTTTEVNRFLSKYTRDPIRVKSRSDALPHILSVIAGMSSHEIHRLFEAAATDTSSSLGVISDAILSRE